MGKNQHVVPAGDKWGIKGEGNSRLTSTFDRQSDAIAAARQISKNQHSELFRVQNLVILAYLPNLATIRPNSTLNDIRCRILHLKTPNIR